MQLPYPPPPGPVDIPGPTEYAFAFCIAYFALLSLVLFALPQKWVYRIIQIAFAIDRRDDRGRSNIH